ncbi:IS256 family transposase [bacterium]|nr:IS256 family transposase [bacterium]
MSLNEELITELLKDYKSPEDLLGKDGILKQLQKAIIEKALEAEMTHHLGYEKHQRSGGTSENSRNGKSKKRLRTESGQLQVEIPRDRSSEFEPQLVAKHQRSFNGFDDKIIALYARGLSTREIQGHLKEIYEVEVSSELISHVTNAVLDEVNEWQSRPLDAPYPIVYLDALFVNIKEQGHVVKKAVYLALGVNLEGHKELLGLCIEKNEGAKFWLGVINELRNRGVQDLFVACVDGLKGFTEAINAVFPKTDVQLCIVHMVRNSLKFVPWKDRKSVARDLKEVYRAATVEQAEKQLRVFAEKWDVKYPMISKSWRSHWNNIIPFFAYPPQIRKAIYTTNAIESLNMSLRKVLKNKAAFPSDQALKKILFLALRNIAKKWSMPIRDWGQTINQFAILHPERFNFE